MPDYPNARDREHGRPRGKCELCDYEAEIARLRVLICQLWVYGTLRPVEGVVYDFGTHREVLERAAIVRLEG